jgi:hypothetical protein
MRPRRSKAWRRALAPERLVDRRLVEAGLLAGERARDGDLLLGRQVDRDLGVVLAAAQHERRDQPPQPVGRVLVVPALDRDGEALVERRCEPSSRGW